MSYDWNFLISVDVISWACPIFGNHILYKLVNFHSVQTLLYLPVLCYDVIVPSTHLHYCTNQFDVQWYPLDIYHLEAMTCKIGKKLSSLFIDNVWKDFFWKEPNCTILTFFGFEDKPQLQIMSTENTLAKEDSFGKVIEKIWEKNIWNYCTRYTKHFKNTIIICNHSVTCRTIFRRRQVHIMYKEVDRVERLTFYVPKMLSVISLWVFLLICLFCPISLCFLESCTNEFFCENTILNFEFVVRHLQFQDISRIEERKTTIMVI